MTTPPAPHVIDMHVHLVNARLPGSKGDPAFLDRPIEEIAALVAREMDAAGVERVLAMATLEHSENDPLGVEGTMRIAEFLPGRVYAIGVADPRSTDAKHLEAVEEELACGRVKALKGYSGYLYYGPDSSEYEPYYALAARYQVPFIFHTGDTYSTRAKVKYAHPLLIDEAAVDHPDVRFVIAHIGNPWLMDAAEVIYKNPNVWADLSGLLVGDVDDFADMERRGVVDKVAGNVADAIEFSERSDRILYGSDWPLAPMAAYRGLVERIIPEEHRAAVFADNACALFGL